MIGWSIGACHVIACHVAHPTTETAPSRARAGARICAIRRAPQPPRALTASRRRAQIARWRPTSSHPVRRTPHRMAQRRAKSWPVERRRVAHSCFAHGARAGARAYQSTSLCTSSRVGPGSLAGRRCGPTRKALPRLCAPSTADRHVAGMASLRDLSNGTVSRIGKMHTRAVRSYTK